MQLQLLRSAASAACTPPRCAVAAQHELRPAAAHPPSAPPRARVSVLFAELVCCGAAAVVAVIVPCCRCHIILSNLRKPGEKAYKIPSGFLFNYVTCANYTAEIWGWILFTVATRTAAAGLFTAAGAIQMADWARGKHRRLQKVTSCAALAAMRCAPPPQKKGKKTCFGVGCVHTCMPLDVI